ncbi:hypothetical protein [Roseburia faecis]|uniref:hypothetical protein n=1 Tax=Roseburia faecis TaxID=301302 RepID=UPI0020706CB3|nr:MAG TPA: hypothetical protein [Caudoviricetes sp.]DAE62324.1 MAG TPA: hypothetical protein [Caudoviricetes sp.]DAG07483.1 MAG TPA: hypothetical protein [Bacteriophage sp.]DAO25901.1 MAG TPA: hypothetical protein [Caudoviricetes sp.]DAQ35004.1 MAG TPA: hypothetical protein [Bacteriophage sp.]
MAEKLVTKNDLLNKLRAYKESPDDDVILYKQKIKNALLSNPCLLYSLNDKKLESELFDKNGNINWEWNEDTKQYEPLGEWDRYFGSDSLIRPFLFIPDTQTTVKCYLCYQVGFRDTARHNSGLKDTLIDFAIFVHGDDRIDKLTGIPRHDLIGSIIRERFAWSNIFGMQAHLAQDYEQTVDNNYVARYLTFQLTDLNSKIQTPYGGKSQMMNYGIRR